MARISHQRKRELVKIKLAEILQKSSNNPLFEGVTIVEVKLSPDSSSAVVFYTMYSTDRDPAVVTKALIQAGGFFQGKLANSLKTRNIPKLVFVYDKGFDHADKISAILDKIDPISLT